MKQSYMGTLPWYEEMTEEECISYDRLYSEVLSNMKYFNSINFDHVAQEGLADGITRMFTGVLNTLMHVVHTFKTNTTKFYKTLKRTELVYFKESNEVTVRRIFNFDYEMMSGLEIPVPNKMTGTYKDVTTKTVNFLSSLDMETRSSLFVKQTDQLRDRVLSGEEGLDSLIQIAPEDLPILTKTFKTLNLCFVGPSSPRKRLSDVLPSKEEMKEVYNLLLNSADFQYGVQRVEANLDSSTKNLNDILAFLQKNTGTLTKRDLMDLSTVAMFYAKVFDMYGVAVQDLSRVEHNFVDILKLIRVTYNL